MHSRPEVDRQPEVEIPADMEISAPTYVRRGFGTARPGSYADPVGEMAQKDKPEIVPTLALPARREVHPENPQTYPNPPFHTSLGFF